MIKNCKIILLLIFYTIMGGGFLGMPYFIDAASNEEICEGEIEGRECVTQNNKDGRCVYANFGGGVLECKPLDLIVNEEWAAQACPDNSSEKGEACTYDEKTKEQLNAPSEKGVCVNDSNTPANLYCENTFSSNNQQCFEEGGYCLTGDLQNPEEGVCVEGERAGEWSCVVPTEEGPSCSEECADGEACADPSGGGEPNPSCIAMSDQCNSCGGEDRVCVDQEGGFACTDEYPDGNTNNLCGGCPGGQECTIQDDGDPQCATPTDERDCGDCPEGQACFEQNDGDPQCETLPPEDTPGDPDDPGEGPGTPPANPQTIEIQNPLSADSIPQLVGDIVRGILGLLGTIALLIIVYAGIKYMTAINNPNEAKQNIQIITNAVIGLIIIMASFLIVQYVISALVA